MRTILLIAILASLAACGGAPTDTFQADGPIESVQSIGTVEQSYTMPEALGVAWTSNWYADQCYHANELSVCIMPTRADNHDVIRLPQSGGYADVIRASGAAGVSVNNVSSFGSPVPHKTQVRVNYADLSPIVGNGNRLELSSLVHVWCETANYNVARIGGDGAELVLCTRYNVDIDVDELYDWATEGQPSSQHAGRADKAVRHAYRWAWSQLSGIPSSYGSRAHRPSGVRRISSPYLEPSDVAPGSTMRSFSSCELTRRTNVTYSSPNLYVNVSSGAPCTD